MLNTISIICKLLSVLCVKAAKRELERQRQLEWERTRRQELLTQRNREQENIVLLKARKKTLEFELEALVRALLYTLMF